RTRGGALRGAGPDAERADLGPVGGPPRGGSPDGVEHDRGGAVAAAGPAPVAGDGGPPAPGSRGRPPVAARGQPGGGGAVSGERVGSRRGGGTGRSDRPTFTVLAALWDATSEDRRFVRAAALAALAEGGVLFLPLEVLARESFHPTGGPLASYPAFVVAFVAAVALATAFRRSARLAPAAIGVAVVAGVVQSRMAPAS